MSILQHIYTYCMVVYHGIHALVVYHGIHALVVSMMLTSHIQQKHEIPAIAVELLGVVVDSPDDTRHENYGNPLKATFDSMC